MSKNRFRESWSASSEALNTTSTPWELYRTSKIPRSLRSQKNALSKQTPNCRLKEPCKRANSTPKTASTEDWLRKGSLTWTVVSNWTIHSTPPAASQLNKRLMLPSRRMVRVAWKVHRCSRTGDTCSSSSRPKFRRTLKINIKRSIGVALPTWTLTTVAVGTDCRKESRDDSTV